MLDNKRKKVNLYPKRLMASLLVMVMMSAPVSQLFSPQTTMAGPGGNAVTVVGDTSRTGLGTFLQNTLQTIGINATALGVNSLVLKEFMDGVFHAAAKVFLRNMVTRIVEWINSGFNGDPAFVTDLGGFMRQIADDVAYDFIFNDPALDFLCTPFDHDIEIALETTYQQSKGGAEYQPQCTLSDVVDNVESFMDGNFSEGGWEGWLTMTQKPQNNPMGAYLSSQNELYNRIIKEQTEEQTKLSFGDGFFSLEICDSVDKASGAAPNCTIGTPGTVIANSINKALGAGQDELIAADEVNEIFNALFSELALKALEGTYGLLGLGGNSNYPDDNHGASGSLTYVQAISERDDTMTLDTSFYAQTSPMAQARRAETEYATLLQKAIDTVDAAEAEYNTTANTLAGRGCSISFSFPQVLTDFRADAKHNQSISNGALVLLQVLEDAFANAGSMGDQQGILEEFERIDSSNPDMFRTEADNVEYELELEYKIGLEINDLEQDLETELNNC